MRHVQRDKQENGQEKRITRGTISGVP